MCTVSTFYRDLDRRTWDLDKQQVVYMHHMAVLGEIKEFRGDVEVEIDGG